MTEHTYVRRLFPLAKFEPLKSHSLKCRYGECTAAFFLISEGARIRAAHFTGVIKDQALQVPLKRRRELAEGSPGKLPADLTIIARFATKGIG